MDAQKPARRTVNIGPKALAKRVALTAEGQKTLRNMVACLHAHPDVPQAMGLKRMSSKSRLDRVMRRIPQQYLRRVSEAACVPPPSYATA